MGSVFFQIFTIQSGEGTKSLRHGKKLEKVPPPPGADGCCGRHSACVCVLVGKAIELEKKRDEYMNV